MINQNCYTLITGASGYLGRAFALECLSRGENLLLTGRSQQKLEELKNYLKTLDDRVKILTFACDLTVSNNRQQLFVFARENGVKISRLINVAGADIQKAFSCYDEDKLTFQIRICFEAAVSLCRFAIEERAEELKIINISSVSGIYPMPYFAIYSAAKSALTSFSIALNSELKGQNASVTAILPGAIYTRSDVIEYIKTQGLWGKIAAKQPDFVARKALKASDKGKAKYIVGGANRLMNAVTKLIPLKLKLHFIAIKWSKTQKDAF
jgi:hypothetical protein